MSGKRNPEQDGQHGKSKRNKSKYYGASKRGNNSIGVPLGQVGFVATCNGGREQPCSREVINLLEQFWEDSLGKATFDASISHDSNNTVEDEERKKINEVSSSEEKHTSISPSSGKTSSVQSPVIDIDKMLASEVSAIKSKKETRFTSFDTGCKGLVFICMKKKEGEQVGPGEIVEAIVRNTFATKQTRTRNTMKLLPAEVTCYASGPEISRVMVPLVDKHFPSGEGQKPITFAVVLESRAHSGLDKMSLIKAVAEAVPSPHSVDLSNPDKTIIVQVLKAGCSIGIVKDFKELAKYNLRQITCPDESHSKEGKNASTTGECSKAAQVGDQDPKSNNSPDKLLELPCGEVRAKICVENKEQNAS